MTAPPIYIPSGGPGEGYPSADKPPDAVLYMRLYAGMLGVACVVVVLATLSSVVFSAAAPRGRSPELFGAIAMLVIYGGGGTAVGVPAFVLLFAPRKPWAHTLGMVMVALGMVSICCMPITIPLLIAWTKPEVKKWFEA